MADTFTVTATSEADTNPNDLTLSQAIADANADANAAIIKFAPSVFTAGNDVYSLTGLTGDLPAISANFITTIDGTTTDGQGITLDAAGHRGLFVSSGSVNLSNLTIENAQAVGAAGGDAASSPSTGGGGGGGGGAGLGGGLFVGSSAAVTLRNVTFQSDAATGGAGGSGSLHGTNGGGGGAGGGFNGGAVGAGGPGGTSKGAGGAGPGFGSGGGGGGSGPTFNSPFLGFLGDPGGAGSFGGGGGGGGASVLTSGGGGGGGVAGFGGGAGALGPFVGGGGGGGLGAGGDIFVQQGGSLTIDSGSLAQGTVTGGTAGTDGLGDNGTGTGYGYGSGLFIDGTQSVTFAPGPGQTVTISGVIADVTGANDPSGLTGAGSLIMNGPGKLVLAADNTPGSSSDTELAGFSGGITIKGGTVDLAAVGAAGSGAITFQDPPTIGRTLEFTVANAPTNEIDGFSFDDHIRIDGFLETSLSYSGGFLTLQGTDDTGTTSETVTLDIPGQALSDFQPNVGPTDTLINYVACYCRGTLIQTARGQKRGQKKVEKLKIGDEVMTASGALRPIKWIGQRSYGGRFIMGRRDILPVCIKASALEDNVPKRDLWISPHHAMFIDGLLIEAKDLINGVSIVQMAHVDKVEYFHIELETHDVIVAEGALSETFIDDNSRAMFHNARDYDVLYPDAAAEAAHYCAPRCEEGYEIETVRRRLALRAGLLRSADAPRIGPLRGYYLSNVAARCIEGWAQNIDNPQAPVCLDMVIDGVVVAQTLANRYRADPEQAGLGAERHGFVVDLPSHVAVSDDVEVRRSADGVALPRSRNVFRRAAKHTAAA